MPHRRLGGCVLLLVLASCAGTPSASEDPITEFQNPKLSIPRRIDAMNRAWADARPATQAELREALKSVAWAHDAPVPLRLAALDKLINDAADQSDARQTASLMIPLEPDLDVVAFLGDAAVAHQWTEVTPALVRSYAHPGTRPDNDRPERRALLGLHPGESIVEITFAIFLHPDAQDAGGEPNSNASVDNSAKTRAAAWELLGRLDPDGSARAPLVAAAANAPGGQDRILEDLRVCQAELRTTPITGEELLWLQSLRDPAHAENAAWWVETSAAVAALTPDQARGLRMRHLEVIRWASLNHRSWAAADRGALLAEASSRFNGREIHHRQVRAELSKKPPSERLAEIEEGLVWGDLLCMLVLDDALHDRAVLGQLFSQAAEDRRDETTEYGGLLFLLPRGYRAASYPPRPSERMGDGQFIASPDMIAQGDLAAAHYHFHVSTVFNSEFSGPSTGDLTYARRFGRNCIVFTSITSDVLSADYYQPDGVVLDLGEVRQR